MISKILLVASIYFLSKYISKFIKSNSLNKKIVPSMDYFFAFSPTSLFSVWALTALGFYIGNFSNNIVPQWELNFDIKIFLVFLSLALITLSLLFTNEKNISELSLNNQKIDKISKILLLISLFSLLFTNIYNFSLGIALFYLIRIYKRRAGFNSLLNQYLFKCLIGFLLFLSGFIIAVTDKNYFYFQVSNLIYSIEIVIISMLFYFSMILSYENQKRNSNFETSKRNINNISFLLLLVVLVTALKINEPLLAICSACSIPFYIFAFFRSLNKDFKRTFIYPLFIFNFFISTIYPYLGICLIFIFYISKYYYWHRFDKNYPTFLVKND
tara:strand:- start:42292 stop:43275 length:984 start_codon:yes stop_codon:yes gene_type:complete